MSTRAGRVEAKTIRRPARRASRRAARLDEPVEQVSAEPASVVAPAAARSVEEQADLLRRPGLLAGQRLALARQLAQAHGNSHMQSVISSARAEGSPSSVQLGTHAPHVQRFLSGEHALVNEAPTKINGIDVTYGELTAMGDLYKNPAQMQKAPEAELRKLLALIRRERAYLEGKPGGSPVAEKEWDAATGGRYSKLAAANLAHFAGEGKSKGHKQTWLDYHMEALELAQKGKIDQAYLVNSFADHFLADAFAAGHSFVPAKARARAEATVEKSQEAAEKKVPDPPKGFSREVAETVLADSGAAATLAKYEVSPQVLPGGWKQVDSSSLAELLEFIRKWDSDSFYAGFRKTVHDRLNREGAEAKTSKDKAGWMLPGEGKLAEKGNSVALEKVRKAVEQSRQNLEDAKGKKDANRPALAKRVQDLIPQLTDLGQKRVGAAVEDLSNADKPTSVDAYARLVVSELPLLIEKLTAKNYARPRRSQVGDVFKDHPKVAKLYQMLDSYSSGFLSDSGDLEPTARFIQNEMTEDDRAAARESPSIRDVIERKVDHVTHRMRIKFALGISR
jgi:hypothetical protein